MPATYVLATEDPELLRAWWVLVPPGRQVITLDELVSPVVMPVGIPTLLVVDLAAAERVPAALKGCATIAVGEPGSSAFERIRAGGTAKVLLGYEESRTRLGAFFPLVEEIAESSAALDLALEKSRRGPPSHTSASTPTARSEARDSVEMLESVVEKLGEKTGMLDEFRRILRGTLATSHAYVFLREKAGFRSDRGDFLCPHEDPLCVFWAHYPVVLDGSEWLIPVDALTEVAVRQRLRQWSARLLVPMHDNGRILGFLALGVRDDGLPYDAADRAKAASLARVLRQCVAQGERLELLTVQNDRWRLAEHYLPNVLVLGPDEAAPKHVPASVRALIGEVRASREARKLFPTVDQPYRASAGLVSDDLGVWVYWEEASHELRELVQKQRGARLALLHDIALTLNHELGNALVSLAALRHNPGAETHSPVLLAAIKRDIASLESINRHLASIPTFSEVTAESADVRALVREVGKKTGVAVEGTGPSVTLLVVPKLVEFALESIVESIAENRPELGKRELSLRVRAVGEGEQLTAQVLIKGSKLALEGIWPAPEPGDVPSHGRISVFVAKEIVRLHGGDLRANHTTLGTEILITLRNW